LKTKKATLRLLTILSLLIVTPLGFLCKFYNGPAHPWFNNYGGDILYQIFWCFIIFFFIPTRPAIRQIPIWIFTVISIIEFLQLWQPPFLEEFRYTFLGKMTLGTQFDWQDFLYYLIGSFLGWLWLRQLWQIHYQKANNYEKTSQS